MRPNMSMEQIYLVILGYVSSGRHGNVNRQIYNICFGIQPVLTVFFENSRLIVHQVLSTNIDITHGLFNARQMNRNVT